MTGFAGRIILEGDTDGARQHLPSVMRFANTLHAWKTTQGMSSVTKAIDLGDGSYAVVADLEHMRAMQVVVPSSSNYEISTTHYRLDYDEVGIMDALGGLVKNAVMLPSEVITRTNAEGDEIEIPVDAVREFQPAQYMSGRYDDITARRRLGVREDAMYKNPLANPEIVFSIHQNVKPGCFTGAMRRVAQLVMGMGRRADTMWEKKWARDNDKVALDRKLIDKDTETFKDVVSPFGIYDVPEMFTDPSDQDMVEVKFKFDHRFAKTHGISFDEENKPWLIQISVAGVHAMPLYLDPISLTIEGRERYLEACPELEPIFEEFGGMPIGTAFPTGALFKKWKDAGEIVELLDAEGMEPFYSKSAFSSVIGWSFNNRGTQAHNCCVGENGNLQTGNHYKVTIKLQKEELPEFEGARATLASILGLTELYQLKKVRRMSEDQVEGLLSTLGVGFSGESFTSAGWGDGFWYTEYDGIEDRIPSVKQQFEELVVDPTLRGQVALSLVKSDNMLGAAGWAFKVPEPIFGGLISYDFRPSGPVPDPPKRFDAPIFVCHIDDEIEVLYITADYRDRERKPDENTRAECQFTGKWTHTTYGGTPYMAGNLYSTRWDWRKEITPDDTVTEYDGKKVSVQGHAHCDFFWICVWVGSTTWFTIKSKSVTKSGKGLRIAAAIPFYDRDCYYMAKHEYVTAETKTEGQHNEGTRGPRTEIWKLYNWVWHWANFDGLCSAGNIDAGKLTCRAKLYGRWEDPSCVDDPIPGKFEYWVCPFDWSMWHGETRPLEVYSPLWSGSYITQPDPVDESNRPPSSGGSIIGNATWFSAPIPSPWGQTTQTAAPIHKAEVWMVSNSGFGPLRAYFKEVSGKKADDSNHSYDDLGMDDWWWRRSPDDFGNTPWMGVLANYLGSNLLNYPEQINGFTIKHKGGPQNLRVSPSASLANTYVGVVK